MKKHYYSLSTHPRKHYGDQLRSDNLPLENINEEVIINNHAITELDETKDDNQIKTSYDANIVDDDDVFYPQQNDLMLQKRHKKCCTKSNCLKCCRQFIAFMISRVGLLILMVGYVLAGGLIFQELESDFENMSITRGQQSIDKIVSKIYDRVRDNSIEIPDESFGKFLKSEIEKFRETVTKEAKNGTLISGTTKLWNFFGAVFYSVTLVSTIGYGHITCKTRNGKIFTIVYSAIGIPLMMLFLANIGSSTAALFKFIYIKLSSVRRRCKMSQFEKHHFRNFDFDDDHYFDFSQSDFEKNDDLISNSSFSDHNFNKKYSKKKNKNYNGNDKLNHLNKKNDFVNNKKFHESNFGYETLGNAPKFNLQSSSESDIFDSTIYAQHLQGKPGSNDPANKYDFDIQLNVSKPNQDKNVMDSSLLNEKKSISLLETSNGSDVKINDVMKRFDYLLSLEDAVFENPLENFNLETIDKQKHLKSVNFRDNKNIDVLTEPNEIVNVETNVITETQVQITVNPIENLSIKNTRADDNTTNTNNDKEIENNQKVKKKESKKFFRGFSIRAKKSKTTEVKHVEETTKPKADYSPINEESSSKSDNLNLKKSHSDSKFQKKKQTDADSKTQSVVETIDMSALPPEYNEIEENKKEKRKFFNRQKAVSLRVNNKKDYLTIERRKSAEMENATIPIDNNLLKPTYISKSQTSSGQNLSQHSGSFKRGDTKSLIYRTNKGLPNGRRLSQQFSTITSVSQFDRQSRVSTILNPVPLSKTQWQYIYNEFQHRHQDKVGVPLMITLIIMPLYMVAGMILFSEFEKWKKLDAFYFAFTTLTTIGFGDLIPGSSLSVHASELHMSISALYILVGLVLIAMCFNLMKKEFKHKVKSIARKIGLSNC